MGPITALIPVTRSVTLGGEQVQVSELRLRDLAFLQAILDGMESDPLASIHAELSDCTPARRRELLADAWDRAEAGPPAYGTDRGGAYFRTAEGVAALIWAATRRETPGMTPARASWLFVRATAAELGLLRRIAHGVTATKSLEPFVFAPQMRADAPGGPSITWAEAVDELSRERNWTYDYIYDLTLTEWRAARNRGKAPEVARVLQPGEDWAAIQEAQRRWFYGDDEPSGEAPASDTCGSPPAPPGDRPNPATPGSSPLRA